MKMVRAKLDLEPAGGVFGRKDDLKARHVRKNGASQRHLGLHVSAFTACDEPAGTLGFVAIRCAGHNEDTEQPETMAIIEGPDA